MGNGEKRQKSIKTHGAARLASAIIKSFSKIFTLSSLSVSHEEIKSEISVT
jgi:hypothetical protein